MMTQPNPRKRRTDTQRHLFALPSDAERLIHAQAGLTHPAHVHPRAHRSVTKASVAAYWHAIAARGASRPAYMAPGR